MEKQNIFSTARLDYTVEGILPRLNPAVKAIYILAMVAALSSSLLCAILFI